MRQQGSFAVWVSVTTSPTLLSASTGCESQNASSTRWPWWRTTLSTTLRRITLGHSPVLLTYPVGAHFHGFIYSIYVIYTSVRTFRSAVSGRLIVPFVLLHTVSIKAFSIAVRRSGTVCRKTSYLLHFSLPSAAYWWLFCSLFRFLT